MSPDDPGLSLHAAVLRGAAFSDCAFWNSKFTRSDFNETDISRTRFQECAMDYFELQDSHVVESQFVGGTARDAAILQCRVSECVFTRTDWSASNWHNNEFERTLFEGVNLAHSSVERNRFYQCTFRGCDLADQTFMSCILEGCTFEDVVMDLLVVKSCPGLEMTALRNVRLVENGHPIPSEQVAPRLTELLFEHLELGEIVEVACLAVVLDRIDVLEGLLARVPDALRMQPVSASNEKWVNLCRALQFWTQKGKLDPYWLLWIFQALLEHTRKLQRQGEAPDLQLIRAATSIAGEVQGYQKAIGEAALLALPRGRMLDPVKITLEVPNDIDRAVVAGFVERLAESIDSRMPPAFRAGAAQPPIRFSEERWGSHYFDFESIQLWAAVLTAAFFQADRILRQSTKIIDAGEGTMRSTFRFFRAFHEEKERTRAQKTALEHASTPTVPEPVLAPEPVANHGLALASENAFQAIAERNLASGIVANVVIPPDLRAEAKRIVLSIEIRK
jgi:hypothetical protein